MARYYHLSKPISKTEELEIIREIKEIENVDQAEFTGEDAYLMIETKDQLYGDVMSRAVNICSRVANGLELSFARVMM